MSTENNRSGGPAIDAGQTATEGFGSMAIQKTAETASAAVAAQAQAAIQARYIMAMKNPRDLDTVRLKLLKECKRPSFAKVARYHKPIGRGVEGPSIRFAEAAVRCMTNISPETQVVFDSAEKRIVRVTVTDLEANVTYSQDVAIEKTVERSKVPDGQTALSSRMNSYGKITYIVQATDDDLLNKQNSLISKALRTLALRLVPGDLIDEAMTEVLRTQDNEDKRDPEAARKAMIDAFASIGVKPSDLKGYLGHDIDAITPPELAHLRALFAAIRDGEANWRDAVEQRAKEKNGNGADKPAEGLKDRVRAKAQPKLEKAHEPSPPAHNEDGEVAGFDNADDPRNP